MTHAASSVKLDIPVLEDLTHAMLEQVHLKALALRGKFYVDPSRMLQFFDAAYKIPHDKIVESKCNICFEGYRLGEGNLIQPPCFGCPPYHATCFLRAAQSPRMWADGWLSCIYCSYSLTWKFALRELGIGTYTDMRLGAAKPVFYHLHPRYFSNSGPWVKH